MSMREFPVRRQPPSRPTWVLPAIIVGAVVAAVVIVIVVVRFIGGSRDDVAAEEAAPEPSCSTLMAAPADELPVPAKVRVNVYNATEVSGLASKTARELKQRGFDVKEVANDPVGIPIESVARIRFGPSSAQRAELLAYYVPGAELVEIDRGGPKIDLALGAAFVGIAAQPDVDAALNTPEAVVTGPGCFGTADTSSVDPAISDPAISDPTTSESAPPAGADAVEEPLPAEE